jgi:osmotically-inducible protein OsmY
MSRRRIVGAAGVLVAAAAVAACSSSQLRRRVRRYARSASGEAHHLQGVLRGVGYRASGHQPDPLVDDLTLADRVRSELGRLERHLDVPHLHVSVRNHVATLHGEVSAESDVEAIERRVLQVAGVWGVRSHLHVGLAKGDTPPSVGRAAVPA